MAIRSRKISRIFEVDDGVILAGSGCWSDIQALAGMHTIVITIIIIIIIIFLGTLSYTFKRYHWESGNDKTLAPSSSAAAQLLAATLYQRRLFPYFSFALLGGVDGTGSGYLYKYDAVGSFEKVNAVCSGR